MGNEQTKTELDERKEPITYFAINIKQPDKLHIVPSDTFLSTIVVKVLETHCSISEHGASSGSTYTITLSGHPFTNSSLGDTEAACVSLRSAWCHLLSDLACNGWEVVTASDLAQKRCNSTIFFRKMVGQLAAEPSRPYTCIAPCSWDKLVIVNLPKSLEPRLTMMVDSGWGIQDTKIIQRTRHGCSLRIKLIGNPWNGETGSAGVQIRQLLLDLVKLFQTQNFKFVANINFRGSADSLFFESMLYTFSLATPEEMFAVSLNRVDRLRLISAPSDVQHNVGGLVQQSWTRGIQQVRSYHGSQEYKLGGTPWWADGELGVESRRLIGSLLASLKFSGWDVAGSLDISRQMEDKTVFMFRQTGSVTALHQKPGAVTQMVDWACISFHEVDKIRFCSGPGKQTGAHDILKEKIKSALTNLGEGIVQRERAYHSGWEWKIIGSPFSGTFGTGDQQRSMIAVLCQIIRTFNSAGWKLVCSGDISAKYHTTKHDRYPIDVHSWFFLYEPSDKLHLAALNPPAQFQKLSRLTKYLALNEKENDNNQIDRFGQFDVAYHNISFDEDETDQG